MRKLLPLFAFIVFSRSGFAFVEVGPLLQIASQQLVEIARLAELIGTARETVGTIKRINEGIDQVTRTLQGVDEILRRSQGLDPKSVQRLSDLRRVINEMRAIKEQSEEIFEAKLELTSLAIDQTGAQAETSYLVGQELISNGSSLNQEAAYASPGRATQIMASSSASQSVAQGVVLQTLAQIAQLQALSLELRRSEIKAELEARQTERSRFMHNLGGPR